MLAITKPAGMPCPTCKSTCAEYTSISGSARWSCSCGASGELTGEITIRSKTAAAPAPPKKVLPHWSQRRRA